MKRLIICEKNIAARRIAWILSDGKAKQKRIFNIPFYQFNDTIVIGLRGHIKKLDFPEEYGRWENVKPRHLIWIEPVKKIGEMAIANSIKTLSKDVEEVIIATDYDREGELIGMEVLDLIPKHVKVRRARFSSITPAEIKRAFENLQEVDINLARSAEARQYIDLIWGASLTRFISIASGQLGRDFLSVGRVQSPTLAMIVEREREIQNFTPRPFWKIKVFFEKDGMKFAGEYPEKIWDEGEADEIYKKLKGAERGRVLLFKKEIRYDRPPPPFDTTSFLKEASSLGMSAPQAMRVAEELYMKGLISYPRTDNTSYPPLPFRNILSKLAKVYPREVEQVFSMLRNKPVSGKKVSKDHPPIHPVDAAPLQGSHAKIFDLIARRFMATLSRDDVVERKKGEIDVNGVVIKAEGLLLKEKNWRRVYPAKIEEKQMPDLNEGEEIKIVKVERRKDKTKPPRRYTQGSLIVEMERKGLGTKATRHEIIGKLYERNYISGKKIVPTPSAFAVVDALRGGAEIITKPDMTAHLEREMDLIAEGKKSFEEVIEESRHILEKAFEVLEKNREDIGREIRKAISRQNYFGKCPKCGGDLVIIKSGRGKRFIGCTNFPRCTNSYPLPQKGKIFFEGDYCEKCGAPIVTSIYKGKKWKKCADMNCGK